MADIDPGGVQVLQGIDPADVQANLQNPAVQLAGALREVSPDVGDLVSQVGAQLQARAQAKAQADAFAESGQPLADAVRAGKIEPQQNPWYIQAYNRDSAEVRGQAAVANLVDQSQTWAERNDAPAYQARFARELGKIAEPFHSANPETLQGFESAAIPLYNQAKAANADYNVNRINQDVFENRASLGVAAIQATLQANPKASPDQVFAGLEPLHRQVIATGGTDSDWREIMKAAVINAGYARNDPDLPSTLGQASYMGGPSLASYADKSGQPFGDQLARAGIYIERASQATMMAGARADHAERQKAATAAVNSIYDDKATAEALVDGKLSVNDVVSGWRAQGLDARTILLGAAQLQADVAPLQRLSDSLTALQQGSGGGQTWNELTKEALTSGYTVGFGNKVNLAEQKHEITAKEADQLYTQAAQRQAHLEDRQASMAQTAQYHAEAQADRAQRMADRRTLQAGARAPMEALGDAAFALEHPGNDPRTGAPLRPDYSLSKDPKARQAAMHRIQDAYNHAISPFANDPVAGMDTARQAAREEAASIIRERTTRRAAPASTQVNP